MKKFVFLLMAMAIVAGCDKSCKNTVEDLAMISNSSGMDITLWVCRGHYGQTMLRLTPTTSGIVSLGTREESKTQGGIGTCNSKEVKNTNIRVSLAPPSFGQVRFCYRQFDNTYIVTNAYQSCPMDYLEQTSTGPCEEFD